MPNRHARMTQLLIQEQASLLQVPSAAAFKMKFNEGFEFGRDPNRQEDPTMNLDPLMEQADEGNAVLSGSLPAILCLNDIGQWLKHCLGDPVTTGTGPYTHTYTLNLSKPSYFLMELGYTDSSKFPRFLGCLVNTMSWSVMEADQNIELGLMGAQEVDTEPTTVFDASPTVYAKNRACSKAGDVYDVQGASTLGPIVEASVSLSKDFEGQLLADGSQGYGDYLVGQPSLGGTLRALTETSGSTIFDHGHANIIKPLTLISKNAAGDATLTVNVPAAELSEAKHSINTSKGLITSHDWSARAHATDTTIVLVNGIASY